MNAQDKEALKAHMMLSVEETFRELDLNRDKVIVLEEMLQVALSDLRFDFPEAILDQGGSREDMIRRYFNYLDLNKDGRVTLDEMKECAAKLIDE